uniref:EGF-like domain-containing protein n=1 Tax=Chromera velia CCMP2878 TaxID=1169474 RepID=A0A0G4HT90_9ALVE|eukprot:Cvel_8411.t1-p1 / transcript=Cvel_8411.t1 / gene=Cvel_8411 / organism=Chromera_velia_CCMP2878 / gene_product=Epidermal growth factor-like protein 6, putative / transcript_product=Epidermal growth factor-like protein 6, putative / location=Cvel_scaffold464:59530-65701(-) / protein_length=973 / sequence_SO=supercontig / SO=protein_coding / is_pseudo=false
MSNPGIAGQNNANNATAEVVLQMPCRMSLDSFGVMSNPNSNAPSRTPERVEVYGSTDGSAWTKIGEMDQQFDWEGAETRAFHTTDSTLFDWFKFAPRRVANVHGTDFTSVAEFQMFSNNIQDLCTDGTQNCGSNALCLNAAPSFTCTCNAGFAGDGVACGIQVPPSDIGRGDKDDFTWTKDNSALYNGIVTIYKDYRGDSCPSQYRVYANEQWLNSPGATASSVDSIKYLASSLFDSSSEGWSWCSPPDVASASAATEPAKHMILGTPCFIMVAGYALQNREDDVVWGGPQSPSAFTLSSANSTSGPWTELHTFDGKTTWAVRDVKTWPVDVRVGPFRFFRFTTRRVQDTTTNHVCLDQAVLYAAAITELDECTAGVHNCDPQATCANTNGSFTCNCNAGLDGDGIFCGLRVPPADIGRGDEESFTWTKDAVNLFNGHVTIFKDYGGKVCPGEYRVFAPNSWHHNPGVQTTVDSLEWPLSSLFDGSTEGKPFCSNNADFVARQGAASDSNVPVILGTPCFITLKAYAWQAWHGSNYKKTPSAITVSDANSTGGPWTTLHSFNGVTDWEPEMIKFWSVDNLTGPFNFFRFTMRKIQSSTDAISCGAQAFLYAATTAELNECAAGIHNCNTNASCSNTNGSFTCACNAGFSGDGVSCSDRDECVIGTIVDRDDFNSLDTSRWSISQSKDEPDPSKTEIFVSSGKLTFNMTERISAWISGRNDVPILWTAGPNGSYTARANGRLLNSPTQMIVGLVAYDNDGDNIEFYHGGHIWDAENGVCFQTIGGSPLCNYVNQATTKAVTFKMHSEGTGVFDFTTWTDPSDSSTRVAVKSDFDNTQTRSRVGLILKAGHAGSAEYDWFELEYQGDLNECTMATHNCDPQATCANTNGSFTCTCNAGLDGDGVVCATQVPPSDIGRGDRLSFTWTKDDNVTFGGFVTIYKDYNGAVCPGRYRVFSTQTWYNNPGADVTSLASDE